MQLLFVQILIFICIYTIDAKLKFNNFKVYSIEVNTDEDYKNVNRLIENNLDYVSWNNQITIGNTADIMIPPANEIDFKNFAEQLNLQYSIKIDNVQR